VRPTEKSDPIRGGGGGTRSAVDEADVSIESGPVAEEGSANGGAFDD